MRFSTPLAALCLLLLVGVAHGCTYHGACDRNPYCDVQYCNVQYCDVQYCEMFSTAMAVGKDAAPLVLAAGSLAALATLTLLAVTVRSRRAAAHAPGVEHVPLAESDECDDSDDAEASTTDDDSEEREREKLTALV